MNTSDNVLWITCHEPRMGEEDYQEVLAKLTVQGFDVSRLEKVRQEW